MQPQTTVSPVIQQMIAVGSGKGGVGKSTIALLLALALSETGVKVGLLDADLYGPSQPTLLGLSDRQQLTMQNNLWLPINYHGLQTMSVGYVIGASPTLWRGPMLSKVLQQFIYGTAWQAVDYLIIDLPPGTGDIQLTLCQKFPLNGVVIVTTSQDLALSDVHRACASFQKLTIPLLGIIENMAAYQCPCCGHLQSIFGSGGGERLAKHYAIPFLGSVPLDPSIHCLAHNKNIYQMFQNHTDLKALFVRFAQTISKITPIIQ